VEYVYSTWQRIGDAAIPGVSFRVVDGRTNLERNVGAMQLVALDSAPRLAVPASPRVVGFAPPAFLRASNPDTIRVGPHSFVLRNPGYAEMVSLARDTVFIFDATQGEERARHDSAWIAALFPGRHALALVVTDAAWPHVAGVRFWVAHGVPVYAPRAVRAFLDSVVERHWTLSPDLLERSRRPMRFVPVSDSLRVAGGDILLFALDGVASEAAIAAYDAPDHTLWASDYIQSAREPTQYLDEVCRATVRVNVTPDRVAAEHLPLTPWPALRPLAKCGP
jgi:hypothetical protein